jgi:MFS family permease
VLIGAFGATVEPAFFSAVMRVRGKPDNDSANSWILGSYALGGIVGPIVGGIVIVVRGAWLGFTVDAISFVLAAGLMAFVTLNQQDCEEAVAQGHERDPWRWTWQSPIAYRPPSVRLPKTQKLLRKKPRRKFLDPLLPQLDLFALQ